MGRGVLPGGRKRIKIAVETGIGSAWTVVVSYNAYS
jgi:hypothetical protein